MATKKKKKISYSEPTEYIPKDIRKKYKLGEYAETKSTGSKKTVKKGKK